MKVLKTLEGEEIPEAEQGAAMEKAHFLWDKTKVAKVWELQGPGIEKQELLTMVYTALSGTSNTSAPGPDGISYKTLKAANKTPLGRALMDQVTQQIAAGTVPREWQDSKVVFIPKPGKDHTQLKAWRPITLINCIGKLGQKVVAEELRKANLLHRHQFSSVTGRSGIDAVFREVTRVQRCLSIKGSAGWGLWDVKGGFQNVREQEVLKRIDKSGHCKRWKGWVKNFFREREFSIEWDGAIKGRGKTNVAVPQGSPLSPVIFLIFIAPILEEMEAKLIAELQTKIEIPSYVDDILVCILNKEKKGDIKVQLDQANMIVNQIAAKWTLPLEKDKHETIVFNPGGTGSGKRKKRAEVERVKWLGIILDKTLEFDHHWKSRVDKARKLLRALSGIGSSQWGISPGS